MVAVSYVCRHFRHAAPFILQKEQVVAFPCVNSITACTSDSPQNRRRARGTRAYLTASVSFRRFSQYNEINPLLTFHKGVPKVHVLVFFVLILRNFSPHH